MKKDLNEITVKSLTSKLNLKDIFDFYQESQDLIKKCPHDNSGVPYPITGFKSPTLFICCKHVYKRPDTESSVKAVNLFNPIKELKAGKYHRCLLLTPQLSKFYKEHFKEIKFKETEAKENKTIKGKTDKKN